MGKENVNDQNNLNVNDQNNLKEKKLNIVISGVKNDVDDFLSMYDFKDILKYLENNFNNYLDTPIPEEYKILLKNEKFLSSINIYIKDNLNNLLDNPGIESFDKISFYLFLLGFGEYNGLLLNLNTYDFNKLGDVFDLYNDKILISGNQKEFDIYYNSFINFINTINTLCLLNQVDYSVKNLIVNLVALLSDKFSKFMEQIKQSSFYNKDIENDLNYIVARTGINFSHIEYIVTKNKSIDEILLSFDKTTKRQTMSFEKATKSNFGNNPGKENSIKSFFLGNLAYNISIMIIKLEANNFVSEELYKNEYFQIIIQNFLNSLNFNKENITIEDIKLICNNVFTGIYFEESKYDLLNENKPKIALDDFFENPQINSNQIETIHNLVMFLPNLSKEELLRIGNNLIKEKFNNFSFESYKLKILDIIINKLEQGNINDEIRDFFEKLINYIEINKISSQLLNSYSKLYLAIAYYYSFCFDTKSQKKALECFSVFSKINVNKYDRESYGKNINKFYENIGFYELSTSLRDNEESKNENNFGDETKGLNISQKQFKNAGKKRIQRFDYYFEIKQKNEIDKELLDITNKSLSEKWSLDDGINNKISELLSSKIFNGIAQTHIIKIDDKDYIKSLKLNNSIGLDLINLSEGYMLVFTYPKIYKKNFEQIFAKEEEYIIQNIQNYISAYLRKKESFIDKLTGLPNEIKLKSIEIDSPVTYLQIKLSTIKHINLYGDQYGDEYIKKVVGELSNIPELKGNVYRLSGAKLGILLSNNVNIENIINQIQNIKVNILNDEYKFDFFMGIVENEINNIFEKAAYALSYAKKTGVNISKYTQDKDYSEKDKKDLEYLSKFDNASENKRVIAFIQPVFDSIGRIAREEALFRIKNDNGEFESTQNYLGPIKKFGRSNKLAKIIMDEIFYYSSIVENKDFSMNISGEELGNEDMFEYIKEKINEYKVDPKRIMFEISEGEWNEEEDEDNSGIKKLKNIDGIKRLKDMGFKIAMDGFGANNSNLARLIDLLNSNLLDHLIIDGKIIKSLDNVELIENEMKKLDIFNKFLIDNVNKGLFDNLKLDNDFISNIYGNENFVSSKNTELLNSIEKGLKLKSKESIDNFISILKTEKLQQINKLLDTSKNILIGIIEACHNVGVKVTAKHIENKKVMDVCEEFGLDQFQGFYLGKPGKFTYLIKPKIVKNIK